MSAEETPWEPVDIVAMMRSEARKELPHFLDLLKSGGANSRNSENPPASPGGTPYGRKALDDEARAVAAAHVGTRNDQLNVASFACGQLVAGGQLVEDEVVAALTAAAQAAGLPARETAATIASGIGSGKEHPRGPEPRVQSLNTSPREASQGEDGPEVVADTFARDVALEAQRLRVREAARDLVAREKAGAVAIPTRRSLADLLTEPDEEVTWSVDRLLGANSKGLLNAQHKAGKTTLGGNLVRSWVDGVSFLGEFPTRAVGKIVVLDNEMGRARLARWYRQLAIAHPDRVDLIDLRGAASSFNILDPSIRSRWAECLAGADAALLDCLRPFLDALGLDEHREAGRFLEALDELMAEAGVGTYVLSHHTGHNGEHARGDSRILDWPDEIWNLRRAKPADPDAPTDDRDVPRFFGAYGRESDVREGQVELDGDGRTLTFRADVSRASARHDAKRLALRSGLLMVIGANPGANSRQVERLLRERGVTFTKGDEGPAITELVRDGLVRREAAGNARLHYLTDMSPTSPGT
ncbi:hypothetical protein GCM10009809_08200 [Isoptericola hypogeus]|uniref:AAA domain-containing protein n=1 Tax=Isoptericola hypogeus TaxID=300179 RepID=A0ABN2IYQ8_9MICO